MKGTSEPCEQTLHEASEWIVRLSERNVSQQDRIAWKAWCNSDPENERAFRVLSTLWAELPALAELAAQAPSIPSAGPKRLGSVLNKVAR